MCLFNPFSFIGFIVLTVAFSSIAFTSNTISPDKHSNSVVFEHVSDVLSLATGYQYNKPLKRTVYNGMSESIKSDPSYSSSLFLSQDISLNKYREIRNHIGVHYIGYERVHHFFEISFDFGENFSFHYKNNYSN